MSHDPRDNRTRANPAQVTLRVGPGGDIEGTDDKALQAGADYLKRLANARIGAPVTGGTLEVMPGTYDMRNALFLHSGLTLRGHGDATVLRKMAGGTTTLTRESDWYEYSVTVEDPSLFSPGCGIMLRGYNDDGGLRDVVRDTVVAVDGNEVHLNRRPERNFWLNDKATAATLHPILTAEEGVCDVLVEDIVLDGNRAQNEEINGNYAGGVFLQQCHRFTFRRVTSRDYNGDGYSFQICDDVHFDDCKSLNNANLGFHPGSGSQRPRFRNCVSRGNNQGIFFCWGVTDGLADGCDCSDNDFGITIGHRDTDNRVHDTTLTGNRRAGLLFRRSVNEFRGAHRNLIENCTFVDNGFDEDGCAIDFDGAAHDVEIRSCRFEDSGAGKQTIGVRLHADAEDTRLVDNEFVALQHDVVDGTNRT